MPEFFDPDMRTAPDWAPAPDVAALMRRHGDGGRCEICQATRCEPWRDAQVRHVMSDFWDNNPTAAAVVRRAQ